jgi:integrase
MAKLKAYRTAPMPGERNIYGYYIPGGRVAYQVKMQIGGRKYSKLCRTFDEARQVRNAWRAGDLPPESDETSPPPEEPAATVEDGLRHYAAALGQRGQDVDRTMMVLVAVRRVYPELLTIPLDSVTVDHLYVYRQRRLEAGTKPNTVIRDLRALRAMIKTFRPDFHVPVAVFPQEDLTRHPMLTPAEEKRIFLAIDEPLRAMARLAALTLMRQGEIRHLRREHIDLHAATVTLPRAKGGPGVVALGREALELLRHELASHLRPYVFSNPRTGRPWSDTMITHQWKAAMRALGKEHFTFHDLRHHGAMVALSNGASFPELQALGRWADPKMVNRYATATSVRLRQLQDRMSVRHQAAGGRRRVGPPPPAEPLAGG